MAGDARDLPAGEEHMVDSEVMLPELRHDSLWHFRAVSVLVCSILCLTP